MIALAELNRLDRPSFVALLGEVFEHSEWVAEAAYEHREFFSVDALHAVMMAAVENASQDVKLRFLNFHPELAGAEARAKTLTSDSTAEQRGAGLDKMSDADIDEFTQLNAAYRQKFGFPFIIAVRGRERAEIATAFRARLDNDVASEERRAFAEIGAITRMRLARLVLE